MKRWILWAGSLIIVTVLGWYIVSAMQSDETVQEQVESAVAVAVEAATQRTLRSTLVYHGTVQARAQVPIIARANGTVDAVIVDVGDPVERNQVLAVLDAEELQLQAAQANAALEVARASLARARAGARPEEIQQAEAGLRQAQANYDNAKANYDRSQVLFEQGALSRAEWEGVQAQYQVATAGLRNAENALEIAIQGAHPEDLRSAEAAVQQAQAAADLAQLAVANMQVKVPLSGTIAQLQLEPGMTVGAGSAVGMVVDAERLRMTVLVGSRDVVQLQREQAVRLTVDAVPGEVFHGSVATVAPAADQASGMFPVVFEFVDADPVRPGMAGTATVEVQRAENVISVPGRAVLNASDQAHVFVVENDRAYRRSVELGIRDGEHVEIRSGLDVDDFVVVVGQHGLRSDTAVRLQTDAEGVVR